MSYIPTSGPLANKKTALAAASAKESKLEVFVPLNEKKAPSVGRYRPGIAPDFATQSGHAQSLGVSSSGNAADVEKASLSDLFDVGGDSADILSQHTDTSSAPSASDSDVLRRRRLAAARKKNRELSNSPHVSENPISSRQVPQARIVKAATIVKRHNATSSSSSLVKLGLATDTPASSSFPHKDGTEQTPSSGIDIATIDTSKLAVPEIESSSDDSDAPSHRRHRGQHRSSLQPDTDIATSTLRSVQPSAKVAVADHTPHASSDTDGDSDSDAALARRRRARARTRAGASNALSNDVIVTKEEASRAQSSSSSSSDEDGSSSSSSSSSSGSDSDSDSDSDAPPRRVRLKPVFVSKRDRITIHERQQEELQQIRAEKAEMERLVQRKQESEQMVIDALRREAEQDAAAMNEVSTFVTFEPEPDPMPPLDEEAELEGWKLRELLRIRRDRNAFAEMEKEREDVERRRLMNDKELLRENMKDEKWVKKNRKKDSSSRKFMQRHYHRGAFFTDADHEVLNRDFSAATGEDYGYNKAELPEVLRVKKFGMKGRTKCKL
jgi:microfibrillar-associated protein 1